VPASAVVQRVVEQATALLDARGGRSAG